MGAYHINENVENRLKAWARKKYKDDGGRIAMQRFTFSDVLSDLLTEVGF